MCKPTNESYRKLLKVAYKALENARKELGCKGCDEKTEHTIVCFALHELACNCNHFIDTGDQESTL